MKRTFSLALLLTALAALVAPPPAHAAGSIRVQLSPQVLLADGISTAVVTVNVLGVNGRPTRDGTEVRFYTTAGNITPLAFTSAGIARATLTASSLPQAANITVAAGIDQTVVTVPMVSKLVETSVGGRVMRIDGKYVAFSEDKRFIQADEQVRVRFRGITLDASSVQVDLDRDTLKALGKISIASDDKTLVGQRLWLDLKSFEGYILAVGTRQWFSGYGLTDLPERPKNLNPDFDLEDLSQSQLLWVGKHANYIVGERVQMQGARAFVGGMKSLRMNYHEANIRGGFNGPQQYVGLGSEGLTLDLPVFLKMSPDASTALRLGYGTKTGGIGNFTRTQGLSVDLVQKYGFTGASEGTAMLTNLSSPDRWGFQWNHMQQLNRTTRMVADLQFPEHRDFYGHLNLTSGLPRIGNVQLAMTGTKFQRTGLAKTLSFAFESKPRPLANGALMASLETNFYYRDQQQAALPRLAGNGRQATRINLPGTQFQSIGLRLRPKPVSLGSGFSLDSSVALRGVTGNSSVGGFGPAVDLSVRKQLPRNGSLALGFNYNRLTVINDLFPSTGQMNTTLSLTYPVNNRLSITALGSNALDATNRNSIIQMSYRMGRSWRVDMLHSLFRFGNVGEQDFQLGLVRTIGGRDLGIYWSYLEHRFIVEFGAARF
ncbi:MAG: hypothetical protein FJX77_03710 [Armatimonadetes bacterium]|nr:hypothetical protein [Armatimonadota bacterium]